MKRIAIVLSFCCLGYAQDRDIRELGLPNPTKVEIVFPYIVFGEGSVEFQTDILVTNSTSNEAYVEFNLYTHTGFPAKKRIGSSDPRSLDRRIIVEPGTVRSLDFPPNAGHVRGLIFVGWGVLRSNEEVEAFQTIRTLELGSRRLHWEANFQGNSKRVKSARFRLQANSGLSVVNPDFVESLTLAVQNWRETSNSDPDAEPELLEEKQISLKPRNQKTTMIGDLFDSEEAGSFVRIFPLSDTKTFSFATLFLRVDQQSGFRIHFPSRSLFRGWLGTVVDADQPWDFPVEIVDAVRIGGLRVFLSAFALFAADDEGNRWGPFNVNGGSRLVANKEAGIVVTQESDSRVAILFADSKKVIHEHLRGEIGIITDLPDLNAVEIMTSGIVSVGCCVASAGTFILIDKNTEEVVGRFSWFQTGTPPWREQK